MNAIVYIISFLEGFCTLAVEIIAIRKAIPVVGSSIILTSILLGIILLALSFWYYIWGKISGKYAKKTLVRILIFNLIFAGIFYTFISFVLEAQLLAQLISKTGSYIGSIFLVAILLFFLPVFIASQTIPLLTELLKEQKKWEAAGKVLFWSTIGSFLGSVLPGILLFQTIWVSTTGYLVWVLLLIAALLTLNFFGKRCLILNIILLIIIGFMTYLGMNVKPISHNPDFELIYNFDSPYQDIRVYNFQYSWQPARMMMLDWAYSSSIISNTKKSFFEYIQKTVQITEQNKPDNIMVIWAAGFTYPYEIATQDYVQNIDVVDIDWTLEHISEQYFLQDDLPVKINFIPLSARYVVNQAIQKNKKYDLVFLDAFNGKSVPFELLTHEFFQDLDQISDHIVINIIADTKMKSDYIKNSFWTIQNWLGQLYYDDVNNSDYAITNFIVSNKPFEWSQPWDGTWEIYTDDGYNCDIDQVMMYHGL